MKICMCASMSFIDKCVRVKDELEAMGHMVYIPEIISDAKEMDKGILMTNHFRKIDDSDCILIINEDKNGALNYIGSNVFLEIGYAYATRKAIYILNGLPLNSPFIDELLAMKPVVLKNNLDFLNRLN